MSHRLQLMGQKNYSNGFKLTLQPQALDLPLRWKKPQRIFVNSMSDLFHDEVPFDFILKVFAVMREASWHHFQILTKRAERLKELSAKIGWTPNIWMGVSVENQKYVDRIDCLRGTQAHVKFLSIEPLLGPIGHLDLTNIDWVIVGGESGPGAREMKKEWVIEIQQQCRNSEVAFFFKQWGGTNKKKTGRSLDGRTYDEFPVALLRHQTTSLRVL